MNNVFLFSYLFVPVAFGFMIQNYKTTNWMWLGLLTGSVFIGVAPFIAIAYLTTFVFQNVHTNKKTLENTHITYHPDGSYTVYGAPPPNKPQSTGALLFKIVGGVIAGGVIAFGLLVIGVILLFTLFPSVACSGNSKGCY